jgi:hypothetical protein
MKKPRKTRKPRVQFDPDNPVLARIREERGLASKIADELDISRSAVWMWKQVPAEHVAKVGDFLRIAKHRIRPDLFR